MLFPVLFAMAQAQDRELAVRLKRRDPSAVGELYDRYGRLAYALIYRIVRDQGTAEDLVQETFLRIWNRAHAFDSDRGSLGAWVLTVARNRAIDYLRSVQGRMAHSAFGLETEYPQLFVDLEKDLLNSDRAKRLRSALKKLNPNQKLVLELAYFEGLSQSEMAERMQQPLGTVKTWVRSALRILREELGKTVAT